LAVTVLCLLAIAGCEPPIEGPTAITVVNGPAFSLRGDGDLARFTVYAPTKGTKIANPFDPASTLWEVQARRQDLLGGVRIDGMRLVYGQIPEGGYTQTVPTNSQPAPRLEPRKIYAFVAWSNLAGELGGDFYVDQTGTVRAVDLGECGLSTGHGVVRTNCATHEPLRDPADIDKFTREHVRASAFTSMPKAETPNDCKPDTPKQEGH
jgi:hypothetical protein